VYKRQEDNGIGIPSRLLAKVTQLNVRAYNAQRHRDPVEGHGIGLYLVNEAVKFLDGEMTIESTEMLGTKVTITLPQQH